MIHPLSPTPSTHAPAPPHPALAAQVPTRCTFPPPRSRLRVCLCTGVGPGQLWQSAAGVAPPCWGKGGHQVLREGQAEGAQPLASCAAGNRVRYNCRLTLCRCARARARRAGVGRPAVASHSPLSPRASPLADEAFFLFGALPTACVEAVFGRHAHSCVCIFASLLLCVGLWSA